LIAIEKISIRDLISMVLIRKSHFAEADKVGMFGYNYLQRFDKRAVSA